MAFRAGVAAAVFGALLVRANEENACDRSQLPWDLELLEWVESERPKEELHITGEYLFFKHGEEKYDDSVGAIRHTMKICDNCTADAYFRYALSPSEHYDMSLRLYHGSRDTVEEVVATSSEGGKRAEKSVFAKLAKGNSYYVDVIYAFEEQACTTAFIELAMKFIPEGGDVAETACYAGHDANLADCDFSFYEDQLTDGVAGKNEYHFEVDDDKPATTAGKDLGYAGFILRPPQLPGHDGQWRFLLDVRTEFLLGGDITAMVSNKNERPSLSECGEPGNVCIFGARGRLKNAYIIDMTVRTGDSWHVYFFRRESGAEGAHLVDPHCVSYTFTADLRAESLEENFISCPAIPLPANLNVPGYYDAHTGEMTLDEDVLLSESKTTQSAVLTPTYESLLRLTVFHETLDVGLSLKEADVGETPAWETVVKSDAILRPEGAVHVLKKGKQYMVTLTHKYDYVYFEAGWKPHCNAAWLRMDVMKLPLPGALQIDKQMQAEGSGGAAHSPALDFSNVNAAGKDWRFTNHFRMFAFAKSSAQETRATEAHPETIAEYEFTLTDATVRRTFQAFVPHQYISGEITASIVPLHSSSVQLTYIGFHDADGRDVYAANVTNVYGNSPSGEDAANLLSKDTHTKWLDHNKSAVVFDFGAGGKAISKINFITGNDHLERDPVRFMVLGTDDEAATHYNDISEVTNAEKRNAGLHLLYSTAADYNFPTMRSFITPSIPLTATGTYRYVMWVPTKLRDHDPFEDVIYSAPDLAGAVLSTDLEAGTYRFALSTGWEVMSDAFAKSDVKQQHIMYGLDVRVRQEACPYIALPRAVPTITRRTYLNGEYRIEHDRSGERNGTMQIGVTITEPSVLNLDVVRSDQKLTKITVEGGSEGKAVESEDYYGNGLHWLTAMLEGSAGGTEYNITFEFQDEGDTAELKRCKGMQLQMSLAAVPTAAESFQDLPKVSTLAINGADGSVVLPFHMQKVFAFSGEKQEHADMRHKMHLAEAAEIRVILNYHFEFIHMYIDICKCADSEYEQCHECGAGRGYTINNGNHLEAQGLEAGYYILKFYETSFSEMAENRVRNQNPFLATIHIQKLGAVGEDDELALCGHQEIQGSLNAPGMLHQVSMEPWTYHSSSEHLVPPPHGGKRTSIFEFHTEEDSIIRLWLPMKPEMTIRATLRKLLSNEGRIDTHWPFGSLPGEHGVSAEGDALYQHIPHGRYRVLLEFNTDAPRECLTYDMELSITPVKKQVAAETKCSAAADSSFPTTMDSHSHEFRHFALPADGNDMGSRFRHVIPFNITSVQGGRVWVDLRSTFEFGGLTAFITRKGEMKPELYPIRYLHRDYITQDLHGPAEYELTVQDMAKKSDNVALKEWVTCNRYNLHLSVKDYALDTRDRGGGDSECTLDFHEEIPNAAIADAETSSTVHYYNNLQIPGDGDGGEFTLDFTLGSGLTMVKFLTHTHSGASISSELFKTRGGDLIAHSTSIEDKHTSLLEALADTAGAYQIKISFDKSEVKEAGSTCDEKVIFSTFDMAVGVMSDALNAIEESCGDQEPAPPKEYTLKAEKRAGLAYQDFTLKTFNHQYLHEITLNVAEELKGGNFYVVVKYDWFLADLRMSLTADGSDEVIDAWLDIDGYEERAYSAVLTVHHSITQAGKYTLKLYGTSPVDQPQAPEACLPVYISVVAAPHEADHAVIEAVDPWMAYDYVPTEPLVIRMILSAHATPSSKMLKAAYLVDVKKDASDTSNHIHPMSAGFDLSPTVIKFGFKVGYGVEYKLHIAADYLKNMNGKPFSSELVDDAVGGPMTYRMAPCSCHDKVHCDWFSPCTASCPCNRCREGALPLGDDHVCKKGGGVMTPAPTSRIITPPPTPVPVTPPPVPPTPMPTPTPPNPPGTPKVTPAPAKTTPGKKPPTDDKSEGGGGGEGSSNIMLLIVVAVIALGLFAAHRKGYIELPLLPKPRAQHHVQLADPFGDDDDDDDGDDDGAAPLAPASSPPRAEEATATLNEQVREERSAAVEMEDLPADDPEPPSPPPPPAAAAPAAAASGGDLDDLFSDGLFAAAPAAEQRRPDV